MPWKGYGQKRISPASAFISTKYERRFCLQVVILAFLRFNHLSTKPVKKIRVLTYIMVRWDHCMNSANFIFVYYIYYINEIFNLFLCFNLCCIQKGRLKLY